MKILLTGSSGYIGSKLKEMLINHEVISFDTAIGLNLLNLEDLNEIFIKEKNIDLVIHLAALSGVEKSENEYTNYINNNFIATFNLLEAMKRFDVKKIIFASSCSVYGSNLNCVEESTLNPESFYGLTKTLCEELIIFYNKKFNIDFSILRIFNVIGDGKNTDFNSKRLIPVLLNNCKNNQKVKIFLQSDNKSSCIRDFINIKDVCEIILKILHTQNNIILNIGTGTGFSVDQICKKISEIIDFKTIDIQYIKKRGGDVDVCISNKEMLIKNIGSFTFVDIEQSIREQIK